MIVQSQDELKKLKANGKILAEIFSQIKPMLLPGVNVMDVESKFLDLCQKYDVHPSCKGYSPAGKPPFPTGLCLSINNDCVHCYPKKSKKLKDGDIVVVDTIIEKDGLYVDSAFTTVIGTAADPVKLNLVKSTRRALELAIRKAVSGNTVGDISCTIQKTMENAGFSVLYEYGGHGIGYQIWEEPFIPNHGHCGQGVILEEGQVIAIEVLATSSSKPFPKVHKVNEWETKLADGIYFAQFEHTLIVGDKKPLILTKL